MPSYVTLQVGCSVSVKLIEYQEPDGAMLAGLIAPRGRRGRACREFDSDGVSSALVPVLGVLSRQRRRVQAP